jgi:CRP-like cAMP-binding protein
MIQDTKKELTSFLSAIYPLPEAVLEEVARSFEQFTYPKNYMLLKQGQVSKHLWFVVKGAIRYFYTDEAGKESTVWFSFENAPVGSTTSFIHQLAAQENIQLLEESTLYRIEYNAFRALLEKHHAFALWYIKMIEEHYALQVEDRLSDLQFLNAKQRYEKLLTQFPQITNRISLGHIASYLNITQETLSRIRAGKF